MKSKRSWLSSNLSWQVSMCSALAMTTACSGSPGGELAAESTESTEQATTAPNDIHIEVVLAARDVGQLNADGTDDSPDKRIATLPATPDIASWMAQAIAVAAPAFAPANIRFVFDPARDVMRVNSTAIGRDCTLAAGVTLPVSGAQPTCDTTPNNSARQNLALSFPHKLVLIMSPNEHLALVTPPGTTNAQWVFQAQANYSGAGIPWVMITSGGGPEIFAHEVSHYFHLHHPQSDAYFRNKATAAAVVRDFVMSQRTGSAPPPYTVGYKLFDGDGVTENLVIDNYNDNGVIRAGTGTGCTPGCTPTQACVNNACVASTLTIYGNPAAYAVTDTPYDPGVDVFDDPHAPDTAGAPNCNIAATTATLPVDFGSPWGIYTYTFTPDRSNAVNYWNKTPSCLNVQDDLTPGQIAVVRASLDSGERSPLLSYSAAAVPMSYSIVNKGSGMVAAVSGQSTSAGGQIVQWGENATLDQRWQFDTDAANTVRIRNVNSGMIAAVTGMSTSAGATVVQWPYNATPDQRWKIIDDLSGFAKIVDYNSNMLWAVEGGSLTNGARVLQYFDTGTPDQRWLFTPQGRTRIKNVHSGKVLAVTGESAADLAQVVQYSDVGSADQQWQFVSAGSGYFRIQNLNSGKVLGVTGMSSSDNALIVQIADNGTSDHLWRLRPGTVAGQFRIQNHDGEVLGVSGTSAADSASIVQFSDNGRADLLWQLL